MLTKEKALKLAKRRRRDAYGTQDHMHGFLSSAEYDELGPLPEGFAVEYIPTWWIRIYEIANPRRNGFPAGK